MTYLIDTNVISELRRKGPDPNVIEWVSMRPPSTLRTVVEAEFAPVPKHEVRVMVTGPGVVQGLVEAQSCVQPRRACRAKVVEGSNVVLTAVPAEGHFLVGWSGACAGRESVCRLPVGGDVGVGVEFQ